MARRNRNIRQGTVVLPASGERVSRHVTFARQSVDGEGDVGGLSRLSSQNSSTDTLYSVESEDHAEDARLLQNGSASDSSSKPAKPQSSWSLPPKVQTFIEVWNLRGAFKCSLGYLCGSMGTYIPIFAALFGKNDGKHMVATVAVYFHPARTRGSMTEATMFATIAVLYSFLVSAGTLGTAIAFKNLGLIELGHALILAIFCTGGLGLVGWTKLKMASPTANVSCSLASIILITTLTKDGAAQSGYFSMTKIGQTATMVVCAVIISTTLSNLLWPSLAVTELRKSMVASTQAFAGMLESITKGFLDGSEEPLNEQRFIKDSSNHRRTFTDLPKNLHEAKYEHYMKGTEEIYGLELRLVECLQRMAQALGGLQNAAKTQFSLLNQSDSINPYFSENSELQNSHSSLVSASQEEQLQDVLESPVETRGGFEEPIIDVVTGRDLFDKFIHHLGPSMRSLAVTIKLMLDELPFGPGPEYHVNVNPHFRLSLRDALSLYTEKRKDALDQLYNNKDISGRKSADLAADQEEVAASCGHFAYSLEDFGKELFDLLEILDLLEAYQETPPARSWNWLKPWRRVFNRKNNIELGNDNYKRVSRVLPEQLPRGLNDVQVLQSENTRRVSNASNTTGYRIWKALRIFRRDDVKFAFKVGAGAAVYALPSYIPATRPIYSHYRGEWGLVSYMIVMSMTLGATNTSGLYRFVGTLIGASAAILSWVCFPEMPVVLALYGWFLSFLCFVLNLNYPTKASFSRFILLTYNITALYAYTISIKDEDEDDDDEGGKNPIITEIAFHRVLSVLAGVTWGLIISRYVWPISARKKLRDGLSVLWLRMALIWKRDPLSCLTETADAAVPEVAYMNISEEIHLQQALMRLQSLLSQIPYEFRLKGPFPIKDFADILQNTQAMLDAFHGMSVIIAKEPQSSNREMAILNFTTHERAELCSRIFQLFYVLSSSMRSGFPLPETLPSIVRSRDRLLTRIHKFRERDRGVEGESEEDFALIYAYVLLTGRISEGLEKCARLIKVLHGVIDEEMLEIS